MVLYRWFLICLIVIGFLSCGELPVSSAQGYRARSSFRTSYPAGAYRGNPNNRLAGNSRSGSSFRSTTYATVPWCQNLVKNREHDFGVVATASKQEHIFEFENTTGRELFLTNVRTSCGCTKPSILTSQLKPGETGRIKAVFNTRSFHGAKRATLTVSVQKTGRTREYGELQFAVKGQIRRDVVFNPGEVSFHEVTLSDDISRTVSVSYAGDPRWKIVEATSSTPGISVIAKEVSRDVSARRVSYDLQLKLEPSLPAGSFQETVTIVTNDAKTSNMSIRVTGRVKPMLEASHIQLGNLSQGKIVKKKWIVRSSTAFRVEQIKNNNPAIQFETVSGEKQLHILTYTLDTSQVGTIDDEITIVTSSVGQIVTKVGFSATIIPATTVSDLP